MLQFVFNFSNTILFPTLGYCTKEKSNEAGEWDVYDGFCKLSLNQYFHTMFAFTWIWLWIMNGMILIVGINRIGSLFNIFYYRRISFLFWVSSYFIFAGELSNIYESIYCFICLFLLCDL